jgi:ribosomal protein S18 acetylase RimI-like enzyme
MSRAVIRPYQAHDLDALHDICLKTGDSGADGTHLYADPRILGEIYAAPYGVLQPDLAFVAQDDQGVAAYVVGAADTRAFEARLEAAWWPAVRARHANPRGTPRDGWTLDQWRAYQIHRPFPTPQTVVDAAPAHLHINLLPRLQGQGMGKALIETLLAALAAQGVGRVHLGCNADNNRALRFYDIYGFRRLALADGQPETVWMTLSVPAGSIRT